MEVINDLVGYESLKIYQNDKWFKFSLDSVLLPNFVTINKRHKNILDLCTGNAPIPLIISTMTKAKIIGVDIQKEVCELAKKTIDINQLENQIRIINADVSDITDMFDSDYFDLITVNPPYFKNNDDSYKNVDIHKAIARHEIKTDISSIIKIVKKLLKNNGYFALIQRTERFFEITELLRKNNLEPKRVQFIYPNEESESNLFLIEAVKNGKTGVKFLKPLYIHNADGSYRDEILKLLKRK